MNFYHYDIHHPDEALVKSILREFESIGDNDYDFDTRFELQDAGAIGQVEMKIIRERATEKHLLMITKRRAMLSLLAWLTFLYTMDKVTEDRFKLLINLFEVKYNFFEELLEDIDYIRSNESADYLGIDFWDYMERESGVMYTPPSAYDWVLYGPTLLLLREQLPNFKPEVIIDDRQHAFLLEAIKIKHQVIKAQLNKFSPILGWANNELNVGEEKTAERLQERFTQRERQIINIFQAIKVLNEEEEYRQLISRPLDLPAIEEFYKKLYAKWLSNCFSYRLFAENGIINKVDNDEGLDYHGQSVLLEHQRSMFVKGEKQTIYGTEDLGSSIGRSVDEQFIVKITEITNRQQTAGGLDFKSVTSGLDSFRRNWVVNITGISSVLLNYYRDGNDSVAWHSDRESVLGKRPVIASVSFGQVRSFDIRSKQDHSKKYSVRLEHGSFLLMKAGLQENWEHRIAKSVRPMKPRVNLTFRVVI